MQRNYDLVMLLRERNTHIEITPNYKYRSEKAHIFLIKFPKDKTYDHGGFVTETP